MKASVNSLRRARALGKGKANIQTSITGKKKYGTSVDVIGRKQNVVTSTGSNGKSVNRFTSLKSPLGKKK